MKLILYTLIIGVFGHSSLDAMLSGSKAQNTEASKQEQQLEKSLNALNNLISNHAGKVTNMSEAMLFKKEVSRALKELGSAIQNMGPSSDKEKKDLEYKQRLKKLVFDKSQLYNVSDDEEEDKN